MAKKAEEETSMLKGIMESLTSSMDEMEKRLKEVQAQVKLIHARVALKDKCRVSLEIMYRFLRCRN